MMIAFLFATPARAQQFNIAQVNDSLWNLTLTVDGDTSLWQLKYPVYRFATADINGDGSVDAVVGVYKASRFFTTPNRRVFIFKNYEGLIRPLWLGSRLSGELVDFNIVDNKVRAIEKAKDRFVVSDYSWNGFGLAMDSVVYTSSSIDDCYHFLSIIKQ